MYTTDDMLRMSIFRKRSSELRGSIERFSRNMSFELSVEEGKGVQTGFKGPSPEAVKSLLVDVRVFLLKRDAVYFYGICDAVINNEPDERLAQKAKECRETWEKLTGPFPGAIELRCDDEVLHGERLLDVWMNGRVFHNDLGKNAFLDHLESTPMGPISYFCLIDIAQKMAGLVLWFDRNIAGPIIDRGGRVPMT
jgi:hypothetical protein